MAKILATTTLKDADDLLTVLGDPGRFQVIQFVLLIFQFVPISMSDLMPIFFNIRPIGIKPHYDLSSENFNTSIVGEEVFFLNKTAACTLIDKISPNFSYVYHEKQWSIIADMDLPCGTAWLANLATTIYFLGQIVGSPLFGWTADAYGRRKTLLVSNVAYTACSVGLIFSRDYVSFVILRFFIGFFRQGMHSAFFILVMEWVQPKRRGTWAAIAQFPFSFGVLLLALAGYLLQNWHYIQIVLAVANFTAVGFVWFAPESLKWLLLHNQVCEAHQICEKVANFNKVALPRDLLRNLEFMARNSQAKNTRPSSFWDCFKTPYVRIFTALCCYIWLATFFTYFSFSFLMTNMSGNIYTNLAISGCLELLPRALGILLAQKLTHRATLIICFLLAGSFAIVSGVIPPGIISDPKTIAKTVVAMLGRMAIVGCFPIVSVVSSELFPTVIRNSGFGWCSIAMKVGAMAAPQLVVLSNTSAFTGLPFVIVGAVSIIGALVTIVLPETTDMKMMATIDEAEAFGTRELLAFYRRKSVAVLTVLKPVAPNLRMRARSIVEKF